MLGLAGRGGGAGGSWSAPNAGASFFLGHAGKVGALVCAGVGFLDAGAGAGGRPQRAEGVT